MGEIQGHKRRALIDLLLLLNLNIILDAHNDTHSKANTHKKQPRQKQSRMKAVMSKSGGTLMCPVLRIGCIDPPRYEPQAVKMRCTNAVQHTSKESKGAVLHNARV